MAEPADSRVAVYIDFDNIVISLYDQVHGRNQFQRDRARGALSDAEFDAKLAEATADIGAVIDFAASYGTLVLTRAYADWSARVNAGYRGQLVARAVDLVQLFPAAAYGKNGADIRLAVDAVEDMFRLPDLTHVVIVAGDSDYIALAQRCKRLGRYVVGIGVAGSTARSLAAACDDFVSYQSLPGVPPIKAAGAAPAAIEASSGAARTAAPATTLPAPAPLFQAPEVEAAPTTKRGGRRAKSVVAAEEPEQEAGDPQLEATRLLERALRIGHEKGDAEWLHSSEVKQQMKRMDPSFSEKALGHRSFTDFLRARPEIAVLDETSTTRLVRLADADEE